MNQEATPVGEMPDKKTENNCRNRRLQCVKQISLPEGAKESNVCFVSRDRSMPCTYVSNGSFHLSPYASSNTLSESMYTASEGLQQSRSRLTGLSEFMDCVYQSTNTSSQTSGLDQLNFYSCHANLSNLADKEDIETLENTLNEQKLKCLEQNNVQNDQSIEKRRSLSPLNKHTVSKNKNTRSISKTMFIPKPGTNQQETIPRILHTKVLRDTNKGGKNEMQRRTCKGGTKALVIRKVRIFIFLYFYC